MTPRIQRLAARLDEIKIGAILVTDETNVAYLSGFTGDSSFLVVEPSRATILTDGRYETQLKTECPTLQLAIRQPSQSMADFVAESLAELSLQRLGFEADQLTVASFGQLALRVPHVEWVETVGEVERLRQIKDADEIAILREAVRIAERAFLSIIPRLTPQLSEREIAFELEATMRALGAEGVSFPPIVGAQPSGALPHYRPRAVALGEAESVLIDWGARLKGYNSDLTRTLHRETASASFRDAYQAVLECQLAAIDAIGPGVEARAVDQVARQSLAAEGLADAFKHGLGHGLGLQIHESPRLAAISEETLRPGMVVTVEPGVYFEDKFGIRIEDDVLVTETGHEVLSRLPKGLDDNRLMR